jgi:hypothetical protein
MLQNKTLFLSTSLLSVAATLLLLTSSLAQSTLRIEEFRQLPDGEAELVLSGATEPLYTIQVKTNLSSGWINLGEQTPQNTGENSAVLSIQLDPNWPYSFFQVFHELIANQPVLDYAGTVGPSGGQISAH